mmetsp:Transcript_79814/g.222202  ORF Transcript_79814/g.222202 Transcript_79814/m.222202 type:complete len:279 (+) Transcript_79814:795-1631(+)
MTLQFLAASASMRSWAVAGSAFRSTRTTTARSTTTSSTSHLPQTSRGPLESSTTPCPPCMTSELPALVIKSFAALALSAASFFSTLFFTCEACMAKRSVLTLSHMESSACVTHAIKAVLLLPPSPAFRTFVRGEPLYGTKVLLFDASSISVTTTRPRAVKDELMEMASSTPCPVTPLRAMRSLPARSTMNIDATGMEGSPPSSTKRNIRIAWLRLETSFMSCARVARRLAPAATAASTSSVEPALQLVTFCTRTPPSLPSTSFKAALDSASKSLNSSI